eukprot:356636-Rhodomonas_salina.1
MALCRRCRRLRLGKVVASDALASLSQSRVQDLGSRGFGLLGAWGLGSRVQARGSRLEARGSRV